MDLLLTLWLLCLASPIIVVLYRRLSPRFRRGPRVTVSTELPRLGRGSVTLERLVADLSRLERQFRELDASDAPNKMQRMQAVSLAYDDVLCECCAALGLEAPTGRPLDSAERIRTECDLVCHGLTW
ncbi:MAG: hypothetical protein WBG36_12205 [Ornithinimicrobium sp.]